MNQPIVIKFGGAAMTDPKAAERLMAEIVAFVREGYPALLVHGGGPEIDAMLRRVSIAPKKLAGLRVTDEPTMEIVEMVLAGKVNKHLVSLIGRAGGKAVGLSGRDAGIIKARKKVIPDGDLGRVGEVTAVDTDILARLMSAGVIPVLCSVAEDADGVPLNINADEAAAGLALAFKASKLALLTDVAGVLRKYPDPSTRIERMSLREARELIGSGAIDSGMIPKITSAIQVIEGGVAEVRILDGRKPEMLREALFEGGHGTTIGA